MIIISFIMMLGMMAVVATIIAVIIVLICLPMTNTVNKSTNRIISHAEAKGKAGEKIVDNKLQQIERL